MVNTFLKIFNSVVRKDWQKIAIAALFAVMASNSFAQAWGGDALCMVATNTKLTIGIAAVIAILLGGVLALFKKGDHLLDTVILIVMICGIAALASVLIGRMGYTISCAGV